MSAPARTLPVTYDQPLPRLWGGAAVRRTALLSLVGAGVWFIGWYQVAGEATTANQIGPMNIAILGVILAGAGQLGWILEGRRAVGRMRRELLGDARPVPAAEVLAVSSEPDLRLIAGTRFYHRPNCAMVTSADTTSGVRSVHEAADRIPCGVCAP